MAVDNEPSQPPATRLKAQVGLIVQGLRDSRPSKLVDVEPPDWQERGTVDYLYQRDAVLVRDEDLDRVLALLVDPVVLDSLINGLTLLTYQGVRVDGEERRGLTVPQVLAVLDDSVGVGVAAPNHVVSIAPGATYCPATEPEETGATDPDPGVCPGQKDGTGVLATVVDTGLVAGAPAGHAWLAGVEGIEDPIGADRKIPPYAGHGTFIAGVLRCMAPASEVFVERVFQQGGALLESDLVDRLDKALDRNPDIISLSAGTRTRSNLPPLSFEAFWERRFRHYKGIVLVAAAGNDGDRGPFWPAAFPWTVSVGALAANWRSRASFSNHGGWVDVYAPGEGLVNAYAEGTFVCQEPPHKEETRTFHGMARWSGTSFSTPLVAGLIAARMSRTGENGREAAWALLARAQTKALPGVGAVLLPCDDDEAGGCGCGHRPDHCGCGHRPDHRGCGHRPDHHGR